MGVNSALPVFVFGPLRDPEVLSTVLAQSVEWNFAEVQDAQAQNIDDFLQFALVDAPDGFVEGLLIRGADDTALQRLNFFQSVHGNEVRRVDVFCDGKRVKAQYHGSIQTNLGAVPEASTPEDWPPNSLRIIRPYATEVMRMYGSFDPADVAQRSNQILTRAQAFLNAQDRPSPAEFKRGFVRKSVSVSEQTIAYSNFFTVEEVSLRHDLFSGGRSEEIARAVFMTADAVTVLPYDPKRDEVLLIEQFRAAMLLRGDPRPWAIEAIAGRIDPGETPEETANREAAEEAGLSLGRLHEVGRYYSAPGSNTEYLISYIAECDLAKTDESLGGLAAEHEDIRSIIVPFDEFDDALRTGKIDIGPLLISGLWLQRERERLRQL